MRNESRCVFCGWRLYLNFPIGVSLSKAVLRAERRILRAAVPDVPRQIPRPAGENAGHRDDAPAGVSC